MNVSNTIKLAIDFVSPFNASEFQRNLERLKEEKEREDYIGVWRTLHKGLITALRVLSSAKGIVTENEHLKTEVERVIISNGLLNVTFWYS